VAAENQARFRRDEGLLFVGKAQEKVSVFRTQGRRNPKMGASYAWLYRSTAMTVDFRKKDKLATPLSDSSTESMGEKPIRNHLKPLGTCWGLRGRDELEQFSSCRINGGLFGFGEITDQGSLVVLDGFEDEQLRGFFA
jgi:hypothetical protein